MSFSANLRTLRLTRGLTQPALAEKADIEQSYLSKLENSRSKPSEDVLTRLAAALETTPEALANGDEPDAGHDVLVYSAIGAVALVLIGLAFFTGRITAIYSINPQQVVAGSHSQPDLTQQILNLAPTGVVVQYITRTDEYVHVLGSASARDLVNTYLTAVHKKYGGEFGLVEIKPHEEISQHEDKQVLWFSFNFWPHGIETPAKGDVVDHPASSR